MKTHFRSWTAQLFSSSNHSGSGAVAHACAATGLLALILTGCAVGPDYKRPAPMATNSMPESFSTNAAEWKTAVPSAHLPRGEWWQLFGELELNRLETLADAQNQQLVAALARLEQSRALVKVARADFFPQFEFDPSYTRQRASFNLPQNGHAAEVSPTYNTFLLPLVAGWEVDLWGKVRRQVETARAQLASTADDMESLKLALQAEVASDYFTLRSLDSEYELLQRTAEAYRRSLELTTNRRKGGIATDLDVSQAETQLKSTEALLPAVRLQRANVVHALATLTGQPATGFDVAAQPTELQKTPSVPVGLPSELLERRPDIASAEQNMAAANAQVGVAKAAFFPSVHINGLAGFESIDAGTILDWPSRFWAVGPTLQLPLFTGGRNRAQLSAAKSAYDVTVANYRQTVLSAFQEVEDQLAAQQLLEEELTAQVSAMQAAQRTLEVANNRYKSGLVTYLEVATAQSAALNLERTVVQLRGQKLVAAVSLIKALGGGWEAPTHTAAK